MSAQLFYFNNTETTLDKETLHSPIHWYLNIYSNSELDTCLRWKSSLINIPSDWEVNLDCQTSSYFNITDGDSADFKLLNEQELVEGSDTVFQKLIVSVFLNDTPGKGSVIFDIYDPENPSEIEEIKFHFIVSLSDNLGEENINLEHLIYLENGVLKNTAGHEINCSVYNLQGRVLFQNDRFNTNINLSKYRGEIIFINIIDEKNVYQIKTVL